MTAALVLLVAVDGSEPGLAATRHAIALAGRGLALDIHLLNVQPPLRSHVTGLVDEALVADYHREAGEAALAEAAALLMAAGLGFRRHIAVGEAAETVLAFAERLGAGQIVLGATGRGRAGDFLLGSVARDVAQSSPVPVTLVRG